MSRNGSEDMMVMGRDGGLQRGEVRGEAAVREQLGERLSFRWFAGWRNWTFLRPGFIPLDKEIARVRE